jgi:F-type H+-transporting ATPase subunit delta
MRDIKVIKNYAAALFDSALKSHAEEEVFMYVCTVVDTLNANSELKNIFYSPATLKSSKIKLIEALTQALKTDKTVEEFLKVLVKNSREYVLDHLVDFYKQILDASKNIKQVKVKSSQTLTEKDKNTLSKYLKTDLIKENIEIRFEEDSSLLGGVLIQYDNNVIDLSIAGALKKIDDMAIIAIVK